MKTCGPRGRDCIEKNSVETFNCSTTCKGMFADISWKMGHPKGKMYFVKDEKKYEELYSEYQNFKNVKHFIFSSGSNAPWSNFGKQILQ